MYWVNLIGSSIISMLASLIFICRLNNVKIKNIISLKNIIIYSILNVIFLFNWMLMDNFNRIIINIFILTIMNLFIILNQDLKKSFFYSLVFMIFSCCIELLSTIILTIALNFSSEDYQNLKYGILIFTILNSTIICLITLVEKIKIFLNNIHSNIVTKFKDNILLFFATLYLFLLCFKNFKILDKNIESFINAGMLIFIVISLIFIAYNIIKKNNAEDKYNQMMEYISKYEKIINEQGKRNHEFNNQLMVLNGYINNPNKLKEYLSSIISEQKGGQNYRIKQLGALPDGGIKGLIYYKLSKMEEIGIKSFLYIGDNLNKSFDKISIDFYRDITKVFGVFIDNAIDAAKESIKKEIEIDIKVDDNYLIISIGNTYKKDIDLTKIGKKGYTSKGSGHGFGLSIVRDICKKNDKIDTSYEIEDEMVKQTILVDLK